MNLTNFNLTNNTVNKVYDCGVLKTEVAKSISTRFKIVILLVFVLVFLKFYLTRRIMKAKCNNNKKLELMGYLDIIDYLLYMCCLFSVYIMFFT